MRAKFEVSSIILTSFWQGVIPPPPYTHTHTSKRTPKNPAQIKVKRDNGLKIQTRKKNPMSIM